MQRKPTKTTRGANAEEKRFMAWVKEQPCCCCGMPGPSIVDHAMGATYKHNKVLIGHWYLLPLCYLCDQVKTQGSRRGFREAFGPMADLWLGVADRYNLEGHEIPNDIGLAIVDSRT